MLLERAHLRLTRYPRGYQQLRIHDAGQTTTMEEQHQQKEIPRALQYHRGAAWRVGETAGR